ncbi:luciferin 4-monooxygenase-like [Anticarsia gemmatalis]|uniref:luciferin 4-monooxygenase-like n=1 Tax=Anticarsia gemmatalis TaxID=129554 RepID=UPI003F75B8EF
MADQYFGNNFVHMYVNELTSRVVAKTGIPSDRFHLGKIILQSLRDDPEFVMQTDGATGESETNSSVLKRCIRCVTSLKKLGVKKDDVLVLLSPNHLDQAIPFYAGWFMGLPVAPADRTMGVYELKGFFDVTKPKVVFCQSEKVQDIQKAIELLGLDTIVISFDKSPHSLSFKEMMDKHGEDIDPEEFQAVDIDPEDSIALLISTSGTTGLPKAASLTHKNLVISGSYPFSFFTKFPSPVTSALITSPLMWLSTIIHYMLGPYMKYSRIQSSAEPTPEHLVYLIKKYEPKLLVNSPTMLATIVKEAIEQDYDLSSFDVIFVGGSAVPPELVAQIRKMTPRTIINDTYGMSELGSLAFQCVGAPLGSCGKRNGHLQYRLVDVDTKKDVTEPNKCGELWLKGPGVFKGYYNNPEATRESFASDGWFMSGDMFYRDENWNFFFVERIKLLLKYKNYQISPVELEAVIRQHPGVLDVAVTGVPDPECGDLPVACVVPRPGYELTADEIKDLVKNKLSDTKQLRGGVLFLKELPLTPSTKLHRRKVKEIAIESLANNKKMINCS